MDAVQESPVLREASREAPPAKKRGGAGGALRCISCVSGRTSGDTATQNVAVGKFKRGVLAGSSIETKPIPNRLDARLAVTANPVFEGFRLLPRGPMRRQGHIVLADRPDGGRDCSGLVRMTDARHRPGARPV